VSARCYFADGPPANLADVAEEGWGVDLGRLWVAAHARYKRHGDGEGRCKVCGCPLDFERWMDEQDAEEEHLAEAGDET
jgi:hypothetical protein